MTTKTFGFLPNLCVPLSIFRLALAAEVLAIILALAAVDDIRSFAMKLGLSTLFIQWIVLMSVFTICIISRLSRRNTVKKSVLIILGVTVFFTIAASISGLIATSYGSAEGTQYWDTLFVFKAVFISIVITLLALRYFYIQNEWEQHLKSDSEAKYDALQSRMRPHFLFNSLNTIAQLTSVDPEKAEDALLDLADIFRSTLDTRNRVTLNEELDVTIRYLRMEGLRLGKRRLSVVWDMDRNSLPFEMEIPPLLIQPLIENAIYHGIQPRKDGGTLGISLYDAGEYLEISVSNPIPPEGTSAHSKGNHIAQENLKNRLQLAYGDRAKLSITKSAHQYRVAFRIPKE